ncbi:MAG: hypothetical protein K0Q50_936 [Vampirovibrio sp.]|jgi:restriction system-associated AAA family ATPase|nr:hypothetical protein [Vampirovibrio sp.]
MKLLRLKITDLNGFRSLQEGFEYEFRSAWNLQDEAQRTEQGFEPFVCAGLNGSGKSNLMEALAAIFFQLEAMRIRRNFLPEVLQEHLDSEEPGEDQLDGFELEYLIKLPDEINGIALTDFAHVLVIKVPSKPIVLDWLNRDNFILGDIPPEEKVRDFLLPDYVLGYSSGENQILSLPFFKMRFVQFDEYWNALETQSSYPGRPESRMTYLDNEFSQAILLCNLLFQDEVTLKPFQEEVGLQELKGFRIILKRSIDLHAESSDGFYGGNPAVTNIPGTDDGVLNVLKLLEADKDSNEKFDPIVTKLKRCATCVFEDTSSESQYATLYLDYWVNEATKNAFRKNFDSPLTLFQAFQVLLTLNLYSVSEELKRELYQSTSHYVSETVPTLASNERIMRFKFVEFTKSGIDKPVMLKSLSDGEHQLLHSLGLCLLFRETNSLFLLDEPETHFNPNWRATFISRLQDCFKKSEGSHEMLITTHTPFLISDSRPEKVLVFQKEKDIVSVSHPDYNTLGASINKITMTTFDKRETIGSYAQAILESLRQRFEQGENKEQLIAEINRQLGDSVEKVLLIKTLLDSRKGQG